ADEKAAAVGRKTLPILKLNDVDVKAWKKNVVMTTATVNELAVAVKLKTIDAAVVWKAVAFSYSKSADIIAIPADKNLTAEVGAAVLLSSSNKEIATKFIDLMVSETGRKILTANGYTVSE
ncbi:MAG: extracellular solute-binding protein, partial [Kiritimatiellae bacterium]|nr:extracellular solute-binding protein [Kiritimatiellia bacterium]